MSETMGMPEISPYKYHAVMCIGKSCGENMPLLQYLKKRVTEEGMGEGARAVRVNRAGCLGVCRNGPVMVVYPQGVWYSDLNESKIDKIIESHFKGGKPVTKLAFHIQPE